MQEGRAITNWTHTHFTKRSPLGLKANAPLHEEVFASLEYLSEIPDVGVDFLLSIGNPNPSKSFEMLHALVRQSRTFYEAGKKLHFRSSALMYYYSFLNLAKARIVLSDPSYLSHHAIHGLSIGDFSSGPLAKKAVFVTRRKGVFHKLYELEMGRLPPVNLRLSIINLLAYCSDVQGEYERAGFGVHRLLPSKARLLAHQASRISWPMVSVFQFEHLRSFKKTLQDFWGYFEEVSPDKYMIRRIFDIPAEVHQRYSYFQSIRTYSWDDDSWNIQVIREHVQAALGSLLESPIYDDGYDFKLALPIRTNYQIPMNQPIAIYASMFYICSLVRYHPEYLEQLLNSKGAWIIERFVRGSSMTLLRYLANTIVGDDQIFSSR